MARWGWVAQSRVFTGSRGSAALTCAAAALCRGPGSRVAKAERPGLPSLLPGAQGHRRDDSVPSWGLRLLSHLGTWNPARIGWTRSGAGEGARSPSPRCRDAPGRAGGLLLCRQVAPSPPRGTVGAASPPRAVEFPPKTSKHARKSCQTPHLRSSLEFSFSSFNNYNSRGCPSSLEHTTRLCSYLPRLLILKPRQGYLLQHQLSFK